MRTPPPRRTLCLALGLSLAACGPLPWVRHRAVLDFIRSESKDPTMRVYLSTDREGTSVEKSSGERVSLAEAQKACEEFECDWWDYKDEKRELTVMHIKGSDRQRWVGYHMLFQKDSTGWVAKAEFLGAERK